MDADRLMKALEDVKKSVQVARRSGMPREELEGIQQILHEFRAQAVPGTFLPLWSGSISRYSLQISQLAMTIVSEIIYQRLHDENEFIDMINKLGQDCGIETANPSQPQGEQQSVAQA